MRHESLQLTFAPGRGAHAPRRRRDTAVHLRADGVQLRAHRQLQGVLVRGRPAPRHPVQRDEDPPGDEPHRRRRQDHTRRQRRGSGALRLHQDLQGRVLRRPQDAQHPARRGLPGGDRPHPRDDRARREADGEWRRVPERGRLRVLQGARVPRLRKG